MPSTQMRPDVGSYSRCSSCRRVDLPQPVVPTRAVICAAGACSVKLCRTCAVGREGKANVMSWMSTCPCTALRGLRAASAVITAPAEELHQVLVRGSVRGKVLVAMHHTAEIRFRDV